MQLVHVHENSESHNVYGCPLKSFSLDGARFIDAVAPTTCERAVRANSGAGQPQNEHLDYWQAVGVFIGYFRFSCRT